MSDHEVGMKTRREIAVYAGVPASNSALAVARRILEEEGALPPAID